MQNYAKLSEIREGDILIADNTHFCLRDKAEYKVKKDENNKQYIMCKAIRHYLDSYLDKKGYCLGLYSKHALELV